MTESVLDNIKRVTGSEGLTNILLQFEEFLDSLDIYAFRNWFEGEIVAGPVIKRHWVSVTLRYELDQMPDPAGGLRLLKYGAQVKYRKHKEIIQTAEPILGQPMVSGLPTKKKASPEETEHEYWLVYVNIPRRFIADLNPEIEADQMQDEDLLHSAAEEDIEGNDRMTQDQADSEDPTETSDEDMDVSDESSEEGTK